jgi:methyltransferase-like protein
MNSTATPTLYDQVPYPSGLYPQTHPDRLATNAILFGMHPPAVERCRVLELGCNDGTNLIALAYALPGSQFIGIDLAGEPIARGQQLIEELKLDNITLRKLNLLHVPADVGGFDYIIAHGLYSWIPAEVRDKLLSVCGTHLTENGVAFVSYNVYPGGHLRDLARGMMRYHVARFCENQEKIHQARALLKALVDSKEKPEPYHQILRRELERAMARSGAALLHDDLSAVNHPVYFHEFAEHAARYGLQYLAEASLHAMQLDSHPPHVLAHFDKLGTADIVRREQYIDFLKCRQFRQTLLCRDGIRLDRSLRSERLYGLRCAANLTQVSEFLDLQSPSPETFRTPAGAELQTDRPVVKVALSELAAAWPQSISVEDLAASIQRSFGDRISEKETIRRQLADALLQAHMAGYVELHAHQAPFAISVSERPTASALARLQLKKNMPLSTLRHQTVNIEDDLSRNLIQSLDGTRDRATLLSHLADLIQSGAVSVPRDRGTAADLFLALAHLSAEFDKNLAELARLGLLVS